MSIPNFKILAKIGTYEKLMRHLGNLRHFQKQFKLTNSASDKSRAESLERDLDAYIEEYFKPIKELKNDNKT